MNLKGFLYLAIGLILLYSCSRHKTENNTEVEVNDTIVPIIDTIFSNIQDNYNNKKTTIYNNLDSIRNEIIKENFNRKDTIKYKFSLEDVGTEGNEGIAYYINNKLNKMEIDIFTSMWKINIQYIFLREKIKVSEETFNIYEKTEIVKKISYFVDFNGIPLEKIDSQRINIFQEVKSTVPFFLN